MSYTIDPSLNSRILATMRHATLLAGNAIMEVYNSTDFEIKNKDDNSPVTIADEKADGIILKELRAAFPEIPIVTEEQSSSHTIQANTFLIVDPLDGTKEFIKRRGDFTVNIAYVVDNVPRLGIVYAPARERLFYTDDQENAVEETGAFDLTTPGPIKNIGVSEPDPEKLIVVASKSHRDQATDDYINKYNVKDMRSAGSSLKFCLVATGEADIYPRLGRTMEWDTAAGQAVLQAAGGHVVRFDNHAPLTYGKDGYENPFFIAYAPGIDLKKG